jgi:hypothetical protein
VHLARPRYAIGWLPILIFAAEAALPRDQPSIGRIAAVVPAPTLRVDDLAPVGIGGDAPSEVIALVAVLIIPARARAEQHYASDHRDHRARVGRRSRAPSIRSRDRGFAGGSPRAGAQATMHAALSIARQRPDPTGCPGDWAAWIAWIHHRCSFAALAVTPTRIASRAVGSWGARNCKVTGPLCRTA